MSKFKISGVLFVWMLLQTIHLKAQEQLTDYLLLAAQQNSELKAKFSAYMAALERVNQVGTLPDPQVAFAYFIQPVETRVGPQQFKISASQMFPWFGSLGAQSEVAAQEAKAKYELFEEAKSRVFQEVKAGYYNLYFNQRAITITKENVELLHSFQKLANSKFEAGRTSAVDAYRIEMELGDLLNQLALFMDKQVVLESNFNQLLNIDYAHTITLPDTLWNIDFAYSKLAVYDSIRAKNHQLLNLALKEQALEYRKAVVRKQGAPTITVGVDYTFVGTGPNNMAGTDAILFPKIGLSIPLYRNKYKAMTNEVLYAQESVVYEQEQKTDLLYVMLEKGWADYADAHRRISLYQTQQQLASKALKMIETNYATGGSSFEEVLRMERKLLKYRLEMEKALTDKQAAIAFFNYLMGN